MPFPFAEPLPVFKAEPREMADGQNSSSTVKAAVRLSPPSVPALARLVWTLVAAVSITVVCWGTVDPDCPELQPSCDTVARVVVTLEIVAFLVFSVNVVTVVPRCVLDARTE